jgi:cell wall-associated NlpC family hydrolase
VSEVVSFDAVAARVAQLQALAASSLPVVRPRLPVVSNGSFARSLAAAQAVVAPDPASGSSSNMVSIAEGEVGQAEQPPGSNDSPRIAEYRTATAGAASGEPWCAYFVSWVAAQAGTPIGDGGSGLGSVAAITSWAQRTGRYLPAGSAAQPGDLILFGDSHVGLVESVNADGSLTTIEGNSSNAVSRVTRMPGEATGYVRLG